MSMFWDLWVAARPTDAPQQRENFTTEVLAAALRRNPAPMLRLLRRERLIDSADAVNRLEPHTQVPIYVDGSTRYLDLVVRGYPARSWTGTPRSETWFECKVGAPVSNDQLEKYAKKMRELTVIDGVPRRLVFLAGEVLLGDPAAIVDGQLLWQQLSRSVTAADGWIWNELVEFLWEIRMTEGQTFPIAARESGSIVDAQGLLYKAGTLMKAINTWLKQAGTGWPNGCFYGDRQVRAAVAESLIRSGHLALIHCSDHPVFLRYGIMQRHGEGWIAVQVMIKHPDRTAVRDQALGELRGRLPGWALSPADEKVLLTFERRATSFERVEEAEQFIKDAITELQAVGFCDLVLRMKSAVVNPDLGAPLTDGASDADPGGDPLGS